MNQLLSDKNLLKEEIKKSNGLTLLKLKKDEILAPLDLLMEIIEEKTVTKAHPVVADFIANNYSLDEKEKEKLLPYLNESGRIKIMGDDLSDENIGRMIELGIDLPRRTKLNKNLFKKYELKLLQKITDDYAYSTEQIISNFLMRLDAKEIMEMDSVLVKSIPKFLMDKKEWFENDDFNDYYKNLMVKAFANTKSLSIKDFKNYKFTKHDKKFLKKLIENTYDVSFDEVKTLNGALDILDQEWFFNEFDYKTLEMYSEKDIVSNKEIKRKIQNRWLELVESPYRALSPIYRLKTPMEKFKEIVDLEFMERAYEKIKNHERSKGDLISMNFEYVDKDYNDWQQKDLWNRIQFCKIISEKFKNKDFSAFLEYAEVVKYIIEKDHYVRNIQWVDDETLKMERLAKEDIKSNLLEWTHSDEFLIYASKRSGRSNLISVEVGQYLFKNKELATPNVIWIVLDEMKKSWGNRYNSKRHEMALSDYETLLTQMIKNIKGNKEYEFSVKNMIDYIASNIEDGNHKEEFIEKLEIIKKPIKKVNFTFENNKTDKNNFILYNKENVSDLSHNLVKVLFYLNDGMKNDILKTKELISPELLRSLEWDATRNDSVKFYLKSYIELHKEDIVNSDAHLKIIKTSLLQREIFPDLNTSEDSEMFDEMISILKEEAKHDDFADKLKSLKKTNAYSRTDLGLPEISDWDSIKIDLNEMNLDKLSSNKIDELYVDTYQKSQFLRKKANKVKEKISNSVYEKRIEEIINKNAFDVYSFIYDRVGGRGRETEIFAKYINQLNFEKLKSLLENKWCVERILGCKSYDKKTSIINFKGFTKEENFYITSKLMSKVKEGYSKTDVFALFDLENRGFIKEYVIKKMPKAILQSYDLRASEISFGSKDIRYINENYTPQEYKQIYKELKNKYGTYFINSKDVNSRYYELIESMYSIGFNDKDFKRNEKLFKSYTSLLNDLKETDPVLYVISYREACFSSLISLKREEDSEKEIRKTRDEYTHEIFNKYMDFEVVLSGVKSIIQEVKGGKINEKHACDVIMNVIYSTYYSVYENGSLKETKKSDLGEEKSLKLFKLLMEEAPNYLFYCSKVGIFDLDKCGDVLIDNFPDSIDWKFVEGLLFPNRKLDVEHSRIQANNWQGERVLAIFEAIAIHAMNTGKKDILENLIYNLETFDFLDKGTNSEMKYQMIPENSNAAVIELLSESLTFGSILKTIKLKMDISEQLIKENVEKKVVKINKTNKI